MVTYADIQRIYRTEKALPGLQKIDDNFYEEYKKLQLSMTDEHRDYLEKLGAEIFERRKVKIILSAMRSSAKEPANMAPVEREFFCRIIKDFGDYKDSVFSLGGGLAAEEKKKTATPKVRIKFLAALPAVIGIDLVHYGPFNEGESSDMPLQNAKILIEQGIAEEA
jgi:DNA replication initiation complex subunit (GINS family)